MSVTLHANDSINLTTGVVTRSAPTVTAPVSSYHTARETRSRILTDSRKRASRNDLSALHYVIRNGA